MATLDQLSDIGGHPSLRRIALTELGGEDANPVCMVDGYMAHLLAITPTLEVVDGRRVGTEGDKFYIEMAALVDRVREVEVSE